MILTLYLGRKSNTQPYNRKLRILFIESINKDGSLPRLTLATFTPIVFLPVTSVRIIFFLVLLTFCFSFSQPLCSDKEKTLLLQFKQSFTIDKFASLSSSAYPKIDSWGRNASDCCAWDGIYCNEDTGRVTGLDLSSSFLNGSIASNSSLFGLTRLERLSLADNNFNYSQIPSSIDRLSELTYLNLSRSVFSGQIPLEILSLSRLSSLDLSHNVDRTTAEKLLQLKNPGFRNVSKSLPSLKRLILSYVDISTGLPESLANSTSLDFLELRFCGLKGPIPYFIGKFHLLRVLALIQNEFTGQIPSFLGNLTQLEFLELANNDFESGNLPWLGGLTKLRFLYAYKSNLIGPMPSILGNLTRLVVLSLGNNELTGAIPLSFARLTSLNILLISNNKLSGEVDFDMFLSLKNMTHLDLFQNKLSVKINPSVNETLPQYIFLGLGACNLTEFPKFLRHQKRLNYLNLFNNRISGNLPEWFWNTSTQSLVILSLGHNFLNGYLPRILPFVNLRIFIFSHNSFTGSLPIPPASIQVYQASSNSFSGDIPALFGSHDPRETAFSGNSPQISSVEVISLSSNKLRGKLPHTFANCVMLRYLYLENNELEDVFPHWLGALPELQVLILGSNGFRGEIVKPTSQEESYFPRLKIIDLSRNNFRGVLPSSYFRSWKAMQANPGTTETRYSNTRTSNLGIVVIVINMQLAIKIKGVDRQYDVINDDLSVLDLSHNNFIGKIPETIASLKGLHSLDLSNNSLSGPIPSSLESLTNLESLDLSGNRLSGKIPQELTQLTFLQYFNISYNRLVGPIPKAGQLGSFESASYEGNSGLCGIPLRNKCEAPEPIPSSSGEEQEGSSSPFNFGWKVVAIGYGCGFVIGVLIGKIVVARRPRWFAVIFRVRIFK